MKYYESVSHKSKTAIDLCLSALGNEKTNEYAQNKINVTLEESLGPSNSIRGMARVWLPIHNSDGSYTFICKINGYALTLDGTNVCAAIRDGSDSQKWYLFAVDRLPGDANEDGSVTVADVLLIQQHLAKWNVSINFSNSDVNGDNDVTVADVLLIQQKLAKWNVTLK